MENHNRSAAPVGSITGASAAVFSKSVVPSIYCNSLDLATADYAAGKVASRLRLRIETARVVCHLAGLAVNHG